MSRLSESSFLSQRASDRVGQESEQLQSSRTDSRRELAAQLSFAWNRLQSVLVPLNTCRIITDEDLRVRVVRNALPIFGRIAPGTPIVDLFRGEQATTYFRLLRLLPETWQALEASAAGQPWTAVFSSDSDDDGLRKWIPYARHVWNLDATCARVVWETAEEEYYLVSPCEYIGPEHDFRIEYNGCADRDPRDLSVTIGGPVVADDAGHYVRRPEADGYTFAFGAMGNLTTELQRRLLPIVSIRDCYIQSGKNHHCVAERIGGIFRFFVDDRLVYSVADPLPLVGPGRGYVALYTCAPGHCFSNVRVYVRPTCLPLELRRQLRELEECVLEVASREDPPSFAQAHFLRPNEFLFTDATTFVHQCRRVQEQEATIRHHLAQAEKLTLLAAVAGGVAHDLNNILGPIVGFPSLIIEQLDRLNARNARTIAQDIRQDIEAIEWSAKRATLIVQDLLSLSRIGRYERRPVDVKKAIRGFLESREMVALRRQYPDIHVESILEEGDLMVLGTEVHLIRVMGNLVRNAFEAIGEQSGQVQICAEKRHLDAGLVRGETRPSGDYVILRISDTGCGLAPEALSRLFEPFFTTKRGCLHSGSGLGLTVVHTLVQDLGGFVDVRSDVGRGTTFELFLPVASASVQAPAPADDIRAVVARREHILVVDDAEEQRLVMRRLLQRLGYTCTTVAKGREAVELFRQAHRQGLTNVFDVVLLDVALERNCDGIATAQAIWDLYPEQRLLLVSGHSPTHRVQDTIRRGAGWLAKPFTIDTLGKAVREVIAAPRPRDLSTGARSGGPRRQPEIPEPREADGRSHKAYTRAVRRPTRHPPPVPPPGH